MGNGTKKDKDVPDGMIVRTVVVGKEIGACGIGNAFSQEEQHRHGGQDSYHGFCNKEDAPTHNQIDGQRESWPASKGYNLIYGTHDDNYPLQRKDQPTQPASHNTDKDGRIGTGYHDVNADMVALAQGLFQTLTMRPMIGSTAEEHEEHAKQKADDSKHHLPTDICCQPHQPDRAQGKDGSTQMRPSVAALAFTGPKGFAHYRPPTPL